MRLKEAAEVEASDRKAAMSSGLGGLRLGEPTCRGGGGSYGRLDEEFGRLVSIRLRESYCPCGRNISLHTAPGLHGGAGHT